MNCSPPGSSVHGISQQGDWSGLSFPSPWHLPNPRIKPRSPAWQENSLPPSQLGRPSLSLGSQNNWKCPRVPGVRGLFQQGVASGSVSLAAPPPSSYWDWMRRSPPLPSTILHRGRFCYASGHVTAPNSRTHVLSLWVLFSICMQTSYVSMPDFLQSSYQAVGQGLSHLCYGTLGVPRRCCVAARDSEDVDSACQSLGPILLLLLLLSRFSCVRLCATP